MVLHLSSPTISTYIPITSQITKSNPIDNTLKPGKVVNVYLLVNQVCMCVSVFSCLQFQLLIKKNVHLTECQTVAS